MAAHGLCANRWQPIDSVRPHRWQPTRLPRPWDSPGKNTGVGCHFLLQYVKVKSLSRVRLLATPWTLAYQAPPSMGFSRQEYWSGLPLPSPCCQEVSIILCLDILVNLTHREAKDVTSRAAAAPAAAAKSLQSCPTLCDPMDCSPPDFSIHGILQARTLEWAAISFSNA